MGTIFTRTFSILSQQSSKSSPQVLKLLERCCTIKQVNQIHAHLILTSLVRYTYITSRLLAFAALSHFYADVHYAHSIFNQMPLPTIFNWNTIINAYSKSSKPEMCLILYIKMRRRIDDGVFLSPNMHTFPILLKACTDFCSLSQVHGQIHNFGMNVDGYVISSLITAYSNCGAVGFARQVFNETLTPNTNIVCWTSLITGYCFHGLVEEARKLFNQMPERSDVSWSAMISGYVRNHCFNEAIQLFHELKSISRLNMNQSLLVSILNACACLGAFVEGNWVHSYIDEKGFEYGVVLGTALVNFYSKCGCTETAQQVFNKMHCKDVMSWSAMIMGLAMNGCSNSALRVFMDMEKSGTKPNAITFIGVLTACSHGGLVDEGKRFFDSMSEIYGISPRIEHYGCIVDLLCRAGKTEEAEQFINCMPMKPDEIIWGALFNGCVMHGHLELGEKVGKYLIEVEPQHSGRYVLLANLYATLGKWESVSELRRLMKYRGVTTVSGWSFIEINGNIQRFIVDDKSHPISGEIYHLLNLLNKELTTSRTEQLYPSYCNLFLGYGVF